MIWDCVVGGKKMVKKRNLKSSILSTPSNCLFIYILFWARLFSYYICSIIHHICLLLEIKIITNHCDLLVNFLWDRLSSCQVMCRNLVIVSCRCWQGECKARAWLTSWEVSMGWEHKLFPTLHFSKNIYTKIMISLCGPFSPVSPFIPFCFPGSLTLWPVDCLRKKPLQDR